MTGHRGRSGLCGAHAASCAAQAGRVDGQVLDGVVIEAGGLDPAGDAGLGQQPADTSRERVDIGGGVALAAQPWPSTASEDGVGGAAERDR